MSHNKPKDEVIQAVDRSFDDLFKNSGIIPLQIVNHSRKWQGGHMTFSFNAKAGLISVPIKGTVDVTDKDVTVDADFGLLEKLFPAKKAQEALSGRIKGLLT